MATLGIVEIAGTSVAQPVAAHHVVAVDHGDDLRIVRRSARSAKFSAPALKPGQRSDMEEPEARARACAQCASTGRQTSSSLACCCRSPALRSSGSRARPAHPASRSPSPAARCRPERGSKPSAAAAPLRESGGPRRRREVTQCASAHSCASASRTRMTPNMPSSSSTPETTLETVMYCWREVVEHPDRDRRRRVDHQRKEAAPAIAQRCAVQIEDRPSTSERDGHRDRRQHVPLGHPDDRGRELEFRHAARRRRRPSTSRRRLPGRPSRADRTPPSRSRRYCSFSARARGSAAGTGPRWNPKRRRTRACDPGSASRSRRSRWACPERLSASARNCSKE